MSEVTSRKSALWRFDVASICEPGGTCLSNLHRGSMQHEGSGLTSAGKALLMCKSDNEQGMLD